jgi:protein-export membrane protein SecD
MSNPYFVLPISVIVISFSSGYNRNLLPNFNFANNFEQKSATVDTGILCKRGGTQLELSAETPRGMHEVTPELLEMLRKSLLKRITSLGIEDVSVIASSRQSLTIQIPGVEDLGQAERVIGGLKQLRFGKQKPETEMRLAIEVSVQKELKSKQIELTGSGKLSEISENNSALQRSTEELARIYDQSDLTGTYVKDAFPEETQDGKRWTVSIVFDEQGSNKFANITKSLAGTGLSLGVFLDDELVSHSIIDAKFAPTGIVGGKATISGQFSDNEANDLAAKLRGGALPASMHLVESRTVGKNSHCNDEVSQSLDNGSVATQPLAPTITSKEAAEKNRSAGTMVEPSAEETFYKTKWAIFIILVFSVVGVTVKNASKQK